MKNFEKDQIQNLDKILGGDVVITISGVLDGIKDNTDLSIKVEKKA
ncbi:MAG TPA: hypothetical protein PKK00_14280 [Bacteroidales bacterium]|nr:hypothetical protein [Bacteroidales bacterium]HPS18355.1 hypothetical protein [Bacteroidales bacterium]